MHSAHEFLLALTVVLGVAAVITVVFQRLHQPVVLGYILAGLIIGPHVPIPLIANPDIVITLSEIGVILLMFGLGLEFSLGKLFRAAPTAGVTAVIQCSFMVWAGYVTGRLLGWTTMESIFLGAVIAISSTTIIAKAFDERGIHGKLRELVVAILIGEDLIAVLLMALLTAVSSGAGLSASELAVTIGRLLGFLSGLVVLGLLVVPRMMRVVVRLGRAETTVVAAVGVCFGISLLAQELGYSVALGAFVAGMLVAESGEVKQIEPVVQPVRDVFAAVFFVSVGMQIAPGTIIDHWFAVLVVTLVVIAGKILSVSLGAFLTGNGTRTSVAAGMSLAQIGEFSFIIASLGVQVGAVGNYLYPVAVAVSGITTLTTPWLIRASGRAGNFVDRKLPKPMQTFVSLYEGWIERLTDRMRSARRESRSRVRVQIRKILLDFVVVAGVVITVSLEFDWLVDAFRRLAWDDRAVARIVVTALGALLALPFCVGILRSTRRLAGLLADVVVPPGDPANLDLGRSPRTVIIATVQLGGVLIAGLPLVALTQPFLPGYTGAIVLLIALTVLTIAFWRTATDLHGHVRAATQAIVEALAAQASAEQEHEHGGGPGEGVAGPAALPGDQLATARELLPGLGELARVEIPPDAAAAGRSLADLELRGATGATVLAIVRGEGGVSVPDAHEALHGGDILGIAGSQEAVEAATRILTERAPPDAPPREPGGDAG
ncbi:MAG: cation:proton antiporter domain-containing protein [Kofleriaceae bacterium]